MFGCPGPQPGTGGTQATLVLGFVQVRRPGASWHTWTSRTWIIRAGFPREILRANFAREFPRSIFSANPSRIILRADFARESLGRFIGADIPENSSRELRARMFRREGSPHDLEDSARVFHARIFQGGQTRADRPEDSRVSFARELAGRTNCASSEGPARSKRAPGPCEGAAGTPPSNPTSSRSLMILTSKLSPAVASTCCCGGDAQPRCWSLGRNLVGWGGDHQPAVRPGA